MSKTKIAMAQLLLVVAHLTLPMTSYGQKKSFDSLEVVNIMQKTADWQLKHEREHLKTDWHYGAFYTGIWALYETTGQEKYLQHLLGLGEEHRWRLLDDIFHADRLTIAQVFLDLSIEQKEERIRVPTLWVLDAHVGRKTSPDVTFKDNPYRFEWWTWCDALYMAPPAFARAYAATGDIKYLDYMNTYWWVVSAHMYDATESLYYRDDRFFDRKTKNGKKVFWSRGNGWVMGGLVRVLQHLPASYPHRDKFLQQYREMAEKIVSIQGKDGLWRSSLLDAEEFPIGESSGSAFFCYALAWGMNQGILTGNKYQKAVRKAWQALVKNVNDEGRLGYVQQVGDSPKAISEDDWQVYGTGAFLLAGSEIIKLKK